MHPVLFSLGPLPISSFGFFLALAFLAASFIVWRLAKLYDLPEEKILDIAILTFFGSLAAARIYFVALHWDLFQDLSKAVLINRYPGLSLYGGILGGILTLWFLVKRAKLNFWQIGDFAAVGFLLALSLGNIGCLLGGCNFGAVSDLPIAISVVGVIGKRLPLSAIESFIFFLVFVHLWKQVIRFHFSGKIVSLFLIVFGLVKLFESFYQDKLRYLPYLPGLSFEHLFSFMFLALGFWVFYKKSKRSIMVDLRTLRQIIVSAKRRQILLYQLKKSWYNCKIGWRIRINKAVEMFGKLPKVLRRRLNVKPTPKDIIKN